MRIAYRSGFNAGLCAPPNSVLSLTPVARAEALGLTVADVHSPWGPGQVRYCNALLHWRSGYVDGCAARVSARALLQAGNDVDEVRKTLCAWLLARGMDTADALLWLCDGATREEVHALANDVVFMAEKES